ncbi:MAG TPA: hypothetical protein VFG21_05675, partial [Xanthomonadaceae bacterium]|nr:hypothetical protein [Xanthomonadaceae bacterium]
MRARLPILLLLTTLAGAAPAQDCTVPSGRPTVQSAVADPDCTRVLLQAGTYPESVRIERSLTLAGVGSGNSVITGAVRVGGLGVGVTIAELSVDASGENAGCYSAVFEVDEGAVAYVDGIVVFSNADGPASGPCPLYADG